MEGEKTEKNEKEENKIRKVLFSEAGMIVSIITATAGLIFFVIVPFYNEQSKLNTVIQEIEYIKTNHLAHTEKDIADIQTTLQSREPRFDKIELNIEKIMSQQEMIIKSLDQLSKK